MKPTWFFAVPRIFEKLKAGIEATLAGLPGEQRVPAQQGLEASLQKVRAEQAGEEVPAEVAAAAAQADEQMFSKLRAQLGLDEALAVNVGAAPTRWRCWSSSTRSGSRWASSGGCRDLRPRDLQPARPDQAGHRRTTDPGVELKLDGDGEVLVKADCIMPGYRNLPEKNAETFTEDGWLRTGDIGESTRTAT